jgi:hypothetical protein
MKIRAMNEGLLISNFINLIYIQLFILSPIEFIRISLVQNIYMMLILLIFILKLQLKLKSLGIKSLLSILLKSANRYHTKEISS